METTDASNDIVHPEVRAHINSLVSALGGFSADDDGLYKLGDDALECLRDLKRWIRFYDEKTNRMDVARCLAEANLVGGDLLQILAMWKENSADNKHKARIALACFEVMVPLTWPIERDPERMTVNHHRHMPVLQLAQLGYKKAIINFDGAQILHTAIRAALPSLAIPIGERSARDQGIIKLVLFFLRNIAMIAPPPGVKQDGDDSLVSRSATIDAFSFQDIFLPLLAIASNMGEDFRTEDVTLMEIIFHLVKRVDSGKLFLEEEQLHKAKENELAAMISKEAAMLKSYKKNAPTRHNRFGSMIWVTRQNGKMSTVTGQDALLNAATRELKMDSSKAFKPPRRARREDMEPKDLGPPVSLNARANKQLRSFVEDFLDSGFNPLFQHVRKSVDREASHVLHYHRGQFFYLVSWFLEAERRRRKSKKSASAPAAAMADEVGSFNLVAGVLNQEMFITMSRALDRAYNEKDWQELTTIMRCFTQILLTVQEMTESGNEEDEEIAENILNRLFYEEATHDAVANIVRTYKDQGFEYLDACTELTHTYLRILESYSKQNVDMQVRSRKRTRRKKKKSKTAKTGSGDADADGDGENRDDDIMDEDESANDEARAEQTSRERKFDFKRFTMRFATQGVVDTFVKFTRYFRDLDDEQLKRAHRYLYRVAFKQEMSVMLFRVDIIHLLYDIVKGPEPLDKSSGAYKEWEELGRQIIKKCVRKLEERPALVTELLFSKINSTAHYLEFGYEKQTLATNPRPAAELEFRRDVERVEQIAIAVGALLDKSQSDHVAWVRKQLADAESERRAWEVAEKAMPSVESQEDGAGAVPSDEAGRANASAAALPITVHPDNDARRTAMFKNPHLRLLMKLVGIERLAPLLDETPTSVWVVPAHLTADQLRESLDLVGRAEFSPPVFGDGELAADQLRRKSAARKRGGGGDEEGDDDNDGIAGLINDDDDDDIDGDEILFARGGPTPRRPDADARKKKKGLRRRRRDARSGSEDAEDAEEVDDAQAEERRRLRRRRELERARKIKSDVYVHASDDETDEERDRGFFLRERLRQEVKDASFGLASKTAAVVNEERTTWDVLVGDDDDEGAEEEGGGKKTKTKTRKRKSKAAATASAEAGSGSEEEEDDEDEDDSDDGGARRPATKKRRTRPARDRLAESEDEDEEALDSPLSSGHTNGEGEGEEGEKPDEMDTDTDDTPLSSSPRASGKVAAAKQQPLDEPMGGGDDDNDDDDDVVVAAPKARQRARAGFIVDSSDEE